MVVQAGHTQPLRTIVVSTIEIRALYDVVSYQTVLQLSAAVASPKYLLLFHLPPSGGLASRGVTPHKRGMVLPPNANIQHLHLLVKFQFPHRIISVPVTTLVADALLLVSTVPRMFCAADAAGHISLRFHWIRPELERQVLLLPVLRSVPAVPVESRAVHSAARPQFHEVVVRCAPLVDFLQVDCDVYLIPSF